MNDRELIREQVKELIDSGNADNEPEQLSIPGFQPESIYEKYEYLLSRKCRKKINAIHATQMCATYSKLKDYLFYKLSNCINKIGIKFIEEDLLHERELYTVNFMGFTLFDDNIEDEMEAVKLLAEELNFLAKENYLEGNLVKLSKVKLADGKVCICSYPLLNKEGCGYAQGKLQEDESMYFREGGMPSFYLL